MNEKEAIKKIIGKAKWANWQKMMEVLDKDHPYTNYFNQLLILRHPEGDLLLPLFDHFFAQCFFGNEYKHEMQQAIVADNPLEYYYKWLLQYEESKKSI